MFLIHLEERSNICPQHRAVCIISKHILVFQFRYVVDKKLKSTIAYSCTYFLDSKQFRASHIVKRPVYFFPGTIVDL